MRALYEAHEHGRMDATYPRLKMADRLHHQNGVPAGFWDLDPFFNHHEPIIHSPYIGEFSTKHSCTNDGIQLCPCFAFREVATKNSMAISRVLCLSLSLGLSLAGSLVSHSIFQGFLFDATGLAPGHFFHSGHSLSQADIRERHFGLSLLNRQKSALIDFGYL